MGTAVGNPTWQQLVDRLVAAGALRTPRIVKAFRALPRSLFVPAAARGAADAVDAPLPIGEGQTVSQPTTVATMLELVQPRPGDRVLDVGTGSGWQAALLAHCVGAGARVVTVERLEKLARRAVGILKHWGGVRIISLVGDATAGAPRYAPYDIIISAAASEKIPPAWRQQLAPGGRLLHPISGMGLRLLRKDRRGRMTAEDYPGYVFVPLVSASPS